jgi:hypothetical protein
VARRAVGHDRTTNADALRRAGVKLLGSIAVVAADEIPTDATFVIANLDERGQPGSHWVCRYDGLWHDPLGSGGRKQRAAFVRRVGSQWTDDDAEQARREDNCGQRCIAALMTGKQLGRHAFKLL